MTIDTNPPAATEPDDWWDRLYDEAAAPDAPAGLDAGPRWWEKPTRALGGARLPDWRTGQTVTLSPSSPDQDDRSAGPSADRPDQERPDAPDAQEQADNDPAADEDLDDAPPPAARPRPRWHTVRGWAVAARSSQWSLTPRVIAFNGTAAGAGYLLGIEPMLGRLLPMAEQGATAMLGAALATGSAVIAWKATGSRHVTPVLPAAPVSRLLLTAGAAELGRRLAPAPVAWLTAHGAPWGLGPAPVSLLLTAGTLCGGLWWLTGPRTRHWWWGARWLARIPFASALLATALYAPGVTH